MVVPIENRRGSLVRVVAAACAFVLVFCGGYVRASQRTFTVDDSIERRVLLDPSGAVLDSHSPVGSFALWSPDGSQFAIRTSHGDLKANTLIERIVVFRSEDLLHATDSAPPPYRIAVEVSIRDGHSRVAGLNWANSSE